MAPSSQRYDLVAIGGGAAGLIATLTAASVGARVALIERDRTGGDCLWTGCVPSKALLASAERAHQVRTASAFGIEAGEPRVDFAAVMTRVRGAIEQAGRHDTPEYLRSEGVDVIGAEALFTGPRTIEAGGQQLRFRTALIATGSRPTLPPIPGLEEVAPLTNESVFDLEELPRRLLVLGGGPIGCELGQALGRLGSAVTIAEALPRLLPREEPFAGEMLGELLQAEGVELQLGSRLEGIEPTAGSPGAGVARLSGGGTIEFDRVLVATGRSPVTDGLGLEAAGIATDDRGQIVVDERLRTTADRIYAAGDVVGDLQFTHVAGYHGMLAMANGLFHARQKVERDWIPWATFTDPEVAHVGLTEAAARERHGDRVETYELDYSELDRAIAASAPGRVEVVTGKRDRVVGTTIVGPTAGEGIAAVSALIRRGGKIADLSQALTAYPTFADGPARAADDFWRRRYLTPRTRSLMRPAFAALRAIDRLRG